MRTDLWTKSKKTCHLLYTSRATENAALNHRTRHRVWARFRGQCG